MCHRNKLRAAIFIPLLLAVLAWPAGAAPPAPKASHYPGQDCKKCHKVRGKAGEKSPAKSAPAGGAAAGTGAATSPTGTTPSKGASPAR